MKRVASLVPAPGARVVIRDAEWVVRRVDMIADGAYQLVCDGVSELVREQEAVYLSSLEQIEVLDPALTRLSPDRSPGFADSLLYMESQLRTTVPNDGRIHVGHEAAMDLVPYQLDPARQALARPRQRILIADAVGLGKTLEAGILVSELIARGRARRILVLAVKSMLTQFQKEFWNRFTIPLTRLDSIGIQRVRSRIPTNHNPFYYYDKAIISIDTLKQDAEYRTYLEQAYWDVIVIDEAHNVADRGTGSLRSRLARLLARRSDTLIMLSATPHDGRARSFASLVNMLDATAITDPNDYTAEDFRDKGLVIRRFKKDIRHQVRDAFRDREVYRRMFSASVLEEAAYDALLAVTVAGGRETTEPDSGASAAPMFQNGAESEPRAPVPAGVASAPPRDLFVVTLEKALFSSPAACVKTIDNRIGRRRREIERGPDAGIAAEVESLEVLRTALARIDSGDYAKYRELIAAITGGQPFRWKPNDPSDRLVVFTERIETLHWLQRSLAQDLKLRAGQLEILHGTMSDIEQQRVVEDFGNTQRPVRLLLCSDVASEGINLHFQCHRLIHFDMPWSLMVFQQRNGRVDRYGQSRTPQIVYLVTESANETIRGDTRILEVLERKDEQAYRNVGDPSAFMNVHDIREEEKVTEYAIASGESAVHFDDRLTPGPNEGDDLLALFLGTGTDALSAEDKPEDLPPPPRSLFGSDLRYCEAALARLQARGRAGNGSGLRIEVNADSATLTLDAPEDLRHRFSYFPREIIPENWRFVLTSDRRRMNDAITESRRDEATWPRQHYLWRLHPVVAWLNDRMLAAFGRHEAPVLAGVPPLAPDETVFVISGLVPNRKSHPLVYEWIGVTFRGERFDSLATFEDLIERTGLGGETPIANRGLPVDVETLARLLPAAVEEARRYIVERRNRFEDVINARLDEELEALERLKARRLTQLELKLEQSTQSSAHRTHREERARRDIDEVFNDYLEWIQDTMTTEETPWLKVICVMVGDRRP